jgi:NADPH:quinone reductase-like Zn-dependent oxidoreductase
MRPLKNPNRRVIPNTCVNSCPQEVTVRPPGEGEVLIAIEAAGVNPVGE